MKIKKTGERPIHFFFNCLFIVVNETQFREKKKKSLPKQIKLLNKLIKK